ncbi:MAG TPA: hypothetical protein VHZ04_03190 [Candidatus Paceibacterota bacterium]|nr:hypothetical protein [Candidatus Paceibacterota bacterium]
MEFTSLKTADVSLHGWRQIGPFLPDLDRDLFLEEIRNGFPDFPESEEGVAAEHSKLVAKWNLAFRRADTKSQGYHRFLNSFPAHLHEDFESSDWAPVLVIPQSDTLPV